MRQRNRKTIAVVRLMIPINAILLLVSCNIFEPAGLKTKTPSELYQLLNSGDIFLVDVHIPEQRHIKGTDLFIPFNQISENLHQFPADKQTQIYLYCEGGPMARSAAKTLIKAGYQNVYNLKGGTVEWIKAGYPLEP